VPAPRPDETLDLFLKDLLDDGKADADGKGEQSFFGGASQFGQGHSQLFGQVRSFELCLGDDTWPGYGCQWVVPRLSRYPLLPPAGRRVEEHAKIYEPVFVQKDGLRQNE